MAWAPDYVTSLELKDYLRIGDTDDDAQIALAVTAASRAVDRACSGRQFGQVDAVEARVYTAEWDRRRRRWLVAIDDLQDVAGLVVEVEDGAIDTYTLEPVNAAQKDRPYELLVVGPDAAVTPAGVDEHRVTATAKWGWTAVPNTIKAASLLQASRFFKRRDAPFGVAGSPEAGSELRLLAKVDPDVAVMVSDYQRWWAAA